MRERNEGYTTRVTERNELSSAIDLQTVYPIRFALPAVDSHRESAKLSRSDELRNGVFERTR